MLTSNDETQSHPILDSSPSTEITLNSSSSEFTFLFNWAKDLALTYLMTDTPNAIPCYEAALPGRGSFCLRDWEHMALGAHFLGLDLENITMMKAFAKTATPEFDYVPAWHIDYYGKIWERAHQVPTIFDAIWTSYQQYLWTGNTEWIEDTELYEYYTNAVTRYLTCHDNAIPNNGIADAPGEDGWENTCTYNETSEDHFREAADGIGMQYQGFKSYAEILKARGNVDGYNTWIAKANEILHMFRTDFWEGSTYYRGRRSLTDYSAGYGKENSFLMLKTLITEPGYKSEGYLDFIWDNCANDNIEAKSYLPDVFFPYGQKERGWHYMKELYYAAPERREYPELPYTFVSHTIHWLMGIDAHAPNNQVCTLPQLPDEVLWAEADMIPVGSKMVKVLQENNSRTTLSNRSNSPINWEIRFYGNYDFINLNGVNHPTTVSTLNGLTISSIQTTIEGHRTSVALLP